MSLTIELDDQLAQAVREIAHREGLEPRALVENAVRARVGYVKAPGTREDELLAAIGERLAVPVWTRYRELSTKRGEETLTPQEHEELVRLSDAIEVWHARRVELVTDLARIRSEPFPKLMERLGLASPLYAYTRVIFKTEFGRTPYSQSDKEKVGTGRDQNPETFTAWVAGAGLKHGISYGASDEVGWKATVNPVSVYDFHATKLHLLGIDHRRLTYYHNGIQRRLTDVHGTVIQDILA